MFSHSHDYCDCAAKNLSIKPTGSGRPQISKGWVVGYLLLNWLMLLFICYVSTQWFVFRKIANRNSFRLFKYELTTMVNWWYIEHYIPFPWPFVSIIYLHVVLSHGIFIEAFENTCWCCSEICFHFTVFLVSTYFPKRRVYLQE
jgi:hypothetical protein